MANCEDEILLNRMYVGDYLNSKNNIGHEIINLFKDDNGDNYIYVNPYGTMSKDHNNKTKTILLVQYCGDCTMEILAKTTDLEQIAFVKNNEKKEQTTIHDEQIKYINKNNITYGGIKLYKAFQNNYFKEQGDNTQAAYLTFKANTLLRPNEPLYISANGCKKPQNDTYNCHLGDDYTFAKQSLRMYLSKDGEREAYTKLEEFINNDDLWEKENTTKKVEFDLITEENNNFLKIIQKENDELVFSNLLKYFFEYNSQAFCKFANEVLKISNFEEKFFINREVSCDIDKDKKIDGYIDLLIYDKKHTIIIENKIKSGINGCSQRHDIESEKVQSQLECYYNYIENLDEYKNTTKKYYIFASDYNRIDKSKHKCAEFYIPINYSEIYKWFKNNSEFYSNNCYFMDFLNALYKHTKPVDNSYEEEMHRRFVAMINKIKSYDATFS